jgi:hypothetical protein
MCKAAAGVIDCFIVTYFLFVERIHSKIMIKNTVHQMHKSVT